MPAREFEFGLDTPAFVSVDESGQPLDGDVVIRNMIEEAVLAEAVGIDSFNIGEHYRPEMMVSGGRAQLIVGRGSLTDSFPLFGYDLADYEALFEERIDLLTRLLRDQPVTWSGTSRSPLTGQYVSPPLPEGHLPTWVGVGGSPKSVIRAARYGLPLMLAIIGGDPTPVGPVVGLHPRAP